MQHILHRNKKNLQSQTWVKVLQWCFICSKWWKFKEHMHLQISMQLFKCLQRINITWVCGTMCNHAVFHTASPDQEIKGMNRLVYFYAELLKAWIIKLLWWFLYKAHSRSTNNWTTIQSIKTHCDFVLYNIPALIRWAVSRLLGVVSSLRLDQFHPDQYSIQSQGLDPGKSKTDWLSTHSHTPVGAWAILTTESKEQIISHSAIGLIKRSVWLSVLNLLL